MATQTAQFDVIGVSSPAISKAIPVLPFWNPTKEAKNLPDVPTAFNLAIDALADSYDANGTMLPSARFHPEFIGLVVQTSAPMKNTSAGRFSGDGNSSGKELYPAPGARAPRLRTDTLPPPPRLPPPPPGR